LFALPARALFHTMLPCRAPGNGFRVEGLPVTARVRPWLLLFCRRAFIGIVTSYLAASFIVGGTRLARPAFFVGAMAWCAWLLWRELRPTQALDAELPRTPRPSLRTLELIAFNITATLVLSEIALRGWTAISGHSLLVSDALDAYLLKPGQDYGGGLR